MSLAITAVVCLTLLLGLHAVLRHLKTEGELSPIHELQARVGVLEERLNTKVLSGR